MVPLLAKVRDMANRYTAITKKDGDWWIGWVEQITGVKCQERTEEELLESLRATLREALQHSRVPITNSE
jgi:hypothetical protein